tara:strand:- start:26855 stop:28081 length:1227 start_codon:yes stop_codon:yes gene_type:complete
MIKGSKHKGSGSGSDLSGSDSDTFSPDSGIFRAEFGQPNTQNAMLRIFRAYQESIIKLLLASQRIEHRLTKVQFLADRMQEEGSAVMDSDITDAAKIQAHHIGAYQTLNVSFTEKQRIIQEYIQLIRFEIKDKAVTPENVKHAMQALTAEVSPGKLFSTFMNHCAHSSFVLDAIVYEVRHAKKNTELTEEDVEIANGVWRQVEEQRYKRLKQKVTDIMAKVEKWHDIIPQPLTDKEMVERERLNPFEPGEDKEYRAERRRLVPGHAASLKQIQDRAVAREAASSYARAKQPLHKQHCELGDQERLEMQFKLGIHPFSKSRQGYGELVLNTVTGNQSWLSKFEGAQLDPDLPVLFPARKEHAIKTLTPFLQLRRDASRKLADDSFEPEANREEVDTLMDDLKKLKISTY